MENYDLEEDEVVLYKGDVTLKNQKNTTQLVLTNKNFVFITTIKKLFAKDQVIVDIFSVSEIKKYKEVPQVIRNGNEIDLYFIHDEISFVFESKNEVRKFMNAALTLITDKNAFVRGVDKVKGTIELVKDTTGIDAVQVAKTVGGIVAHKAVPPVGKGFRLLGHAKKEK